MKIKFSHNINAQEYSKSKNKIIKLKFKILGGIYGNKMDT